MAKEFVTLQFRDVKKYHLAARKYCFVAAKPGRREKSVPDELLKQFLNSGINAAIVVERVLGKQPGFVITMKSVPSPEELRMLYRVKRCFIGAGSKITELPKGSTQ